MGNIDAKRDWGHAKIMLNSMENPAGRKPDDFVVATGRQESVRKFIELAAKEFKWGGIKWEGKGINEVGRRLDTNEIVIKIDQKYFRPCEVNSLVGDASKASNKLGWKPKITLEELVRDMIKNDMELSKKEYLLKNNGYKSFYPRE